MKLHEAARAYLGVPFRHQGRNPAVALDCIGLLVVAGRDVGLPVDLYDRTDYGKDPVDGTLECHLTAAFGNPVARNPRSVSQLQPDDIVAMDYAGAIRHVGIVGEACGRLTLIHTSEGIVNRVTEHGIDAKWLGRIAAIYRPEIPA